MSYSTQGQAAAAIATLQSMSNSWAGPVCISGAAECYPVGRADG
jgi:hypothetical protein